MTHPLCDTPIGTIPVNMGRREMLATAALLFLQGCGNDEVEPLSSRYEAAVGAVLERDHVPGALVSVVVPGEQPWRRALGFADLDTRAPMDLGSHFPIRSITKSFTVTAILQLVRDGALSLDDRLEGFFPGFPNGDRITIADLAGMRSGIADYSSNPDFVARLVANPAGAFTEAELAAYGRPGSPRFEPGTQYEYSNTNTVLLGMIVEALTAQTLADALRSQIYLPLGLSGTAYPHEAALPVPHPTPYSVHIDTGLAEVQPLIHPSSLAGAGAMVTTLADLEAWGGALGDGRLVGARLQQERINRSHAATNGPEYERYGLGIGSIKGWWGHTGSGVGWQAATLREPVSGAVIALVVNATPVGGRRNLNLAQNLFESLADVVVSR